MEEAADSGVLAPDPPLLRGDGPVVAVPPAAELVSVVGRRSLLGGRSEPPAALELVDDVMADGNVRGGGAPPPAVPLGAAESASPPLPLMVRAPTPSEDDDPMAASPWDRSRMRRSRGGVGAASKAPKDDSVITSGRRDEEEHHPNASDAWTPPLVADRRTELSTAPTTSTILPPPAFHAYNTTGQTPSSTL